jgi:tetratricopeptide (TPR) repeat protein
LMSDTGDDRLAEKHWRHALALARGDVATTAELQAYLGKCLCRQERWREALRLFEQAFAADERVAHVSWALKWAGGASAKLRDYAAAVDYLRRSLAAPEAEAEDPIRTYLWLGQCLIALKRCRDAGEALRDGLRLAPPNHEDQPDLRKWLQAANELASRE